MQIGFVVAEMSLSSHRLSIDIQILNGLSPKEEHVIRILWVSCCTAAYALKSQHL